MSKVLLPGEQLGRYTIEKELGRGPMGISYLARDQGEIVAIKVLQAKELLNEDEKVQVARDFEALEDLANPHIPLLVEFVRYDDCYVIANDYLPLGNLSSRLAQGALSLPAALALMKHLTYAAGCAHRAGLVHGGIKPSNVLRSERDGHHVPVLADFGGTLRAHAWTPPKDAAQARSYWAPELRETGPKTVAADVYALGKLLSATTGSRGGDEVAAVIAKATSRLPEDRYPDALAMHEALEAIDIASSSTAEASAGEKPAAAVASASTPDAASAASPVQPLAVAAEALASQPDGDDLPPMGFYTPPSRAADFRSKGPIIALVAALALLALVLSLVFTKSNVFNRPTEVPVPSVAKTKSVYRGVQFTLNQPAQPSDHKHVRWLEVSADGSWQQVGGVTYTARTSVGGEKACVQFRVADQNEDGTDITYGTPISACGESNPPALKVKIDPNNCVYNGFPQVCYTFVAEGFEPGSTHILTLRLSNQLIGTLQLTVDKSGHATLPKGQHFHFESTAGGKIASVTYAGLTQNWIVANV